MTCSAMDVSDSTMKGDRGAADSAEVCAESDRPQQLQPLLFGRVKAALKRGSTSRRKR
jgi:hypothetical protein